jgi:thiamine pyrophosphokinase
MVNFYTDASTKKLHKERISMHVLLFAGGTVQAGSAVERTLAAGELTIAADMGAALALRYGLVPTCVVGDFDSLLPETREELARLGCQFIAAATEKDETDTELAIEVALQLGATRISLLGVLGGTRFDHTFANLLLLTAYESQPIEIVDGNSRGWLLRGPGETKITGKAGDLLSLLPLTTHASGVQTKHLAYPLHHERLSFGRPRGISNVLQTTEADVTLEEGLLLVVHTEIA